MKIELITPARRSRKGNWITAVRWARLLRQGGHQVTVRQTYAGGDGELLIALHAGKSFPSIAAFRHLQPGRPIVVAMTGTDLYRDIHRHNEPRQAMAWADRLIVLQSHARDVLAPELRHKTRVIVQSAVPSRAQVEKTRRWFDVCVVGHLRSIKDPFRAAEASRLLPADSRLRVVHAGAALDDVLAEQAHHEMANNPRYRWLGERAPWQVRRLLARSHAMVLSSRSEGGANVVSEAVVAGLPVIATRIPGSVGLLGEEHPAYFEVGDTAGLATLLHRCETDQAFLTELATRSRRLAPQFDPARERAAWHQLLAEFEP